MTEILERKNYWGVSEATLSIEVTTHCNSPCLHCFARAGIPKPSSLPIDLVKEIITEGYNTAYRHLHITGGEPLLWEGLFMSLDYAFDLGYKSAFLNTNGALFTDDVSRRLSSYDGLSISVSLDGPEKLHDSIRGEGSHRRTTQVIEKALEAGIDLIVFTTACKSLLQDLPHFVDELYKTFSSIKYLTLIQLMRVSDDIFALSEELLEPKAFLKMVQTVALLNLYGLKTYVLNDPIVNVASNLLEMPWIPQSQPLYGGGSIIIMANRDISLAHSIPDSFGKYEPGMIGKVLNSDEYRKAIEPDLTTCPACKYAELCKENGMLRPSEMCRDMHPEVPFCMRALDMVAP